MARFGLKTVSTRVFLVGFRFKQVGNDVLLIKMRFGILGVDLAQVWSSILDVWVAFGFGFGSYELNRDPMVSV